jgi:spore maturation protein CgeB
MNILVLGNMGDLQSGLYVVKSLDDMGHTTQHIDTREIVMERGIIEGQKEIIGTLKLVTIKPDLVIVLKGLEMTPDTVQYVKDTFNCNMINWFFDVYLEGTKIWENKEYFDTLKKYDYFFCSLKGVADILIAKGFSNVRYLAEGCFPELHSEQYMNNFQKKKYGQDITFCGTIGLSMHPNRITILKRVISEGFWINIYGVVASEWKRIPAIIKPSHTQEVVINERHSMVAQTSLINLGIDQDPELSLSQSARMYRVMCAGGLYLTTYVKDLETMFKINEKNKPITSDQELVVYYDENDLIDKLDFLLAHDDIRTSIAKNGQKIVKEKHTFKDRLEDMLKIVSGD